jgi:hypothetical protein
MPSVALLLVPLALAVIAFGVSRFVVVPRAQQAHGLLPSGLASIAGRGKPATRVTRIPRQLAARVDGLPRWFVATLVLLAFIGLLSALSDWNWAAAVIALPIIALGVFATSCLMALARAGAGWALGFQIVRVGVGPVAIARTASGLAVVRARREEHYLPGALCLPRDDEALSSRSALYLFSGPAAGLLVWLIALSVVLASPRSSDWPTGVLLAGNFLLVVIPLIAMCSVAIGINLPGGTRITWRGERYPLAMFLLLGRVAAGDRPRDWNLLPLADAASDGAENSAATNARSRAMDGLMRFYQALDAGNAAAAEESITQALEFRERCGNRTRAIIVHEAAYLIARRHKDVETALQWLGESRSAQVERHLRLRAEAAILLADGRRPEARDLAQAAAEGLDEIWERGLASAEREWLGELIAAASRR